VVVRAEGLGKRYAVGERHRAGHATMHHAIEQAIRAPLRWLSGSARNGGAGPGPGRVPCHDVWVLRGVSFEVRRGEILGLLGHNGAGKSVLLKILARVTAPTEGRARIRGRLGSMLEAGAGFHPELTGRENVFLSGAILGMSRPEIARRFDDIVEFAGTGEYVDTPLKRYSSGMSVRLAIAVATHLGSDVLLVDEVLAVGDEAFRRRTVGKLRSLAAAGCAVVLVSHDLAMVQDLCDRALLLGHGRLLMDGPVEGVVARILEEAGDRRWADPGP
jgi:lipopolysaccharide transport system ATP-binding protein